MKESLQYFRENFDCLQIMKLLKKTLDSNAASVVTQTLFHISFSTATVHCHSVWTNFTAQQLDPALRTEIRNLVQSGVTNSQTIKAFLCKWVKENIGDVNNLSRAYWPSKKTIRNYVLKYAPHVKNQRSKIEKTAPKIKSNCRKKRRLEKKYNYESYDLSPEIPKPDSPPMEICVSSSEIPELDCTENDYQYQIICSTTETFDSDERSVTSSEIRELVKTIYDRSLLLPDDCTDTVLRDKLLDVFHLINNCTDHDQSVGM